MAMIDKIRKDRLKKVKEFRNLGVDPYPSKSSRDTVCADIVKDYGKFKGKKVTVAGRIMLWRDFGKIVFAKLVDGSGSIQLYIKKENLDDTWEQLKLYDVGDFVDATGTVTKTKTGEISVEVKDLQILVKAIRPLPEKWEGLKDIESRYRLRYLDLLLNKESRERLIIRSKIVKAIREFFWKRNFVEVDCPVLQPLYGGGHAKPFISHVEALNMKVYLAISNELYLKRAIVGGIDNVFTIGRLFRNEGIDRSHYPEFSMLETMSAYKNYEYNMDLTEDMYKYICKKVFGKLLFNIGGQEVNFGKKWERVMMIDAVREYSGLDFEKINLTEANKELKKVNIGPQNSVGEALVEYMESQVAPSLIQPTIVYGHPVEISPLCKRIPGNEKYVERFELYIGGIETGDNWTELNDPVELHERFKGEQKRQTEEKHPVDTDFIEAMEYGMPPTTGLGPGIERLVMMLTETENIDDVIWFPIMKPTKEVSKKDRYIYDDKKITVVIADDLDAGVAMNVVGHLNVSIGKNADDIMGRTCYIDASGKAHTGISRYPVIILSAARSKIREIVESARKSNILCVDYPAEMYTTKTDDDLNNALKEKKEANIEYYGVALCGDTKVVGGMTKGLSLYK